VLLNAAAAVAAHDGLADADLEDAMATGLRVATESVDGGAAEAVLDRWIAAGARLR
jgi:anthranilate phosphoribosyltransferase